MARAANSGGGGRFTPDSVMARRCQSTARKEQKGGYPAAAIVAASGRRAISDCSFSAMKAWSLESNPALVSGSAALATPVIVAAQTTRTRHQRRTGVSLGGSGVFTTPRKW